MSDAPFPPVATLADLNTLDSDEVLAGYREWSSGDPEHGRTVAGLTGMAG